MSHDKEKEEQKKKREKNEDKKLKQLEEKEGKEKESSLKEVAISKDELLQHLKEEDKKLFLSSLEKKQLKPGEIVEKKGSPQTAVYILEEGELLKIISDQQQTKFSPGAVSGLLHFLSKDASSATIQAGDKGATVWTITGEKFQELLSKNPDFSTSYINFLSKKIRKISHHFNQDGKAKIAFFDSKPYMSDIFRKVNEKKNYGLSFSFYEVKLSKKTAKLASGHKIICVFVNDKVDSEVISKLSSSGVEMIALRCAGFDNVDLKVAKEQNLVTTRVPAYSPYAVAEFAITLLMNLNRKVHKAYHRVKELNFDLNHLVGFDLHGKTVGIVGTGKIGFCFASIVMGFGCKVIAFDIIENDELKKKGVKYLPKDELLQQSDIISIHAPLNPKTRHWLDKDALSKVERGVYIINTSRGPLVDTEALLEAVLDGKVAGAGLDVIEGEENLFFENNENEVLVDSVLARLIACPNIILTSHQAFLTKEALKAIAETTLESVKAYVDGKKGDEIPNLVKE